MRVYAAASARAVLSCASPAMAQDWYDPQVVLHHIYVEGEGGASVEGRTRIDIAATGLGSSEQSANHTHNAFGGALAGYAPVQGVAVEAEGFYSRDNLNYSPSNPVFGIGGATRLYGGFGNLRLSLPVVPTFTVPLGARAFPIGIDPYISPGIGRGNVEYAGRNGAYSYEADRDGFIWQAKAGVEIRAGRHFGLDIAYRYIQAPNFNHPDTFNSSDYSAYARSNVQAVTAGLKYYF